MLFRSYLVVVALEESKERSLGTGGALDASEPDVIPSALNVSQVPEELLQDCDVSVQDFLHVYGDGY